MKYVFEIPKGLVIRYTKGKKDSFDTFMDISRKYKFTGYYFFEGEKSEGHILIKSGVPVGARYIKEKKTLYGKKAYEKIEKESTNKKAKIELHAKVDSDEILEMNPEMAFDNFVSEEKEEHEKEAKPQVEQRKEPKPESKSDELIRKIKLDLKIWEKMGYNTLKLREALFSRDKELFLKMYKNYKINIKRLEELKKKLTDIHGYAEEKAQISEKMFDPFAVDDIENTIKNLEKKTLRDEQEKEEVNVIKKQKEKKTQEEGVYNLLVKTSVEADKCPICDSELNTDYICDNCGWGHQGLITKFTFDNFVIGQNSRFAYAASLAVAQNPGSIYNPMIICSPSGLGKTHLMNAIGNYILKENLDLKVKYTSTEKFTTELIESLQKGELIKFREEYSTVDVLFLDDIQFLADKERTQEELFYIFNALTQHNKQIVFASDRPPKEIRSLQHRLVTRFEAGLLVEVTSPDYETRIAILKKKSINMNINITDDIVELIAKNIKANIRELEGALNKIVAFSRLMNQKLTISLAKDVLKLKEEEEEDEQVEGNTYIFEEEKPDEVFIALTEKANKNYAELCISRVNPKRISKRCNKNDMNILWLTEKESEQFDNIEPSLERIMFTIENFIRDKKSVVLLEGLGYLISENSFDAVIQFIRRIVDMFTESESVLLLSLNPYTLNEKEVKTIEKEMDIVKKFKH